HRRASLERGVRTGAPGNGAAISAMVEAMSPAAYIAGGQAVLSMDLRASLAGINTPVLVIVGERDTATPPVMGEQAAQQIAGSRLARLETAHLSNIEQPAAFNQLVSEFLARSDATALT